MSDLEVIAKLRKIVKERKRIGAMTDRSYQKDKASLELCGLENEFLDWLIKRTPEASQ